MKSCADQTAGDDNTAAPATQPDIHHDYLKKGRRVKPIDAPNQIITRQTQAKLYMIWYFFSFAQTLGYPLKT